jgi:hypothetical protein
MAPPHPDIRSQFQQNQVSAPEMEARWLRTLQSHKRRRVSAVFLCGLEDLPAKQSSLRFLPGCGGCRWFGGIGPSVYRRREGWGWGGRCIGRQQGHGYIPGASSQAGPQLWAALRSPQAYIWPGIPRDTWISAGNLGEKGHPQPLAGIRWH